VLDNWPMYVFSIDIPFKGSQSLAKMTSKVTAESMTPLNFFKIYISAQRYQ
jgi:hypothetical protein